MKELLRLSVTQIRIFAADTLGFRYFRSPSSIADIKQQFGFDSQASPFEGLPVEAPSLVFTSGQFEFDNKKYLVESLTLEDRRIIFTISAESAVADRFFSRLIQILRTYDLREAAPEYAPIVLAQETVCVAKLDLKLGDLLCNSQENIQRDIDGLFSTPGYNVRVFPTSIRFAVHYLDIPDELKNHKITMADKDIAIEVRVKTDPDEGVFFTRSPFDSNSHLKLIEMLEHNVKRSQ
jgi:hypothetical protein